MPAPPRPGRAAWLFSTNKTFGDKRSALRFTKLRSFNCGFPQTTARGSPARAGSERGHYAELLPAFIAGFQFAKHRRGYAALSRFIQSLLKAMSRMNESIRSYRWSFSPTRDAISL